MFTLNELNLGIAQIGIDPSKVTIVAVSKTVSIQQIEDAVKAGFTHFGESRVQEAEEKIPYLREKYPHLFWHMIGHLQTNKAKKAVELFDFIQSVDSVRLAEEISKRAQALGKEIKIMLEIKVSEEENKFGIEPEKLCAIIQKTAALPALSVTGLMTIAPLLEDKNKLRPYFRRLKDLSVEVEKLDLPNVRMQFVSMGMSDDFEVALEEGSNLIRLGRMIFGPR
ncbi:MAG: YggS family pyridoxal phosphate-dependent enzyme [Candidatus Saganbacteria bacterium]|nr:YggS family pyridoxal phosphate-dependent enzyme [Candidatus Saganbacteria bacterium]